MEHRIGWLSGGRSVPSVRVGPAALSSPVPMQRVGWLAGGGHACQVGGACGCGGSCEQQSRATGATGIATALLALARSASLADLTALAAFARRVSRVAVQEWLAANSAALPKTQAEAAELERIMARPDVRRVARAVLPHWLDAENRGYGPVVINRLSPASFGWIGSVCSSGVGLLACSGIALAAVWIIYCKYVNPQNPTFCKSSFGDDDDDGQGGASDGSDDGGGGGAGGSGGAGKSPPKPCKCITNGGICTECKSKGGSCFPKGKDYKANIPIPTTCASAQWCGCDQEAKKYFCQGFHFDSAEWMECLKPM
jgi:hypothetical protein